MTDDPYRVRCPRCFCWMSKDREHEGICGFCERSPSGKWEPVSIAHLLPTRQDPAGLPEMDDA
jgi:hypothetical protein